MDDPQSIFARYLELQEYVAWTAADRQRIAVAFRLVAPHFPQLVDDFYAEIQRHPNASRVLTGGRPQIDRLKLTLTAWLRELFSGPYDQAYVARRWGVGLKHVEIRLPQVFASAALARLRNAMIQFLAEQWHGDPTELSDVVQSLNKLLDLDLAIISDAYDTDHVQRQQAAERRRLHDVLHQEKELSAGLLAHAQAAVLVLDQQGKIARCNAFVEHLTRLSTAELQDRDWFELFLAPEVQSTSRQTLLAASSATMPAAISSVFQTSGGDRQFHWSAVPLLDAAGRSFAVLVIGHDITDLHAAQQRALQAERLAAIGQMAAGLAHESRSALQRISASVEMLELEVEGNSAALGLLSRIQQAQAHLHQLLDEVRTYAAPIVLDTSACRITEVWREAWALLHSQRQQRRAILTEHIHSENLHIQGDRFRLVQVFRNILDNALAAGGDQVKIDIDCEPVFLASSPALRICVRDNGPGLNAEQRRRIFEPFYTTKPTGTGLGMAITHRIIEAHAGTITVADDSTPGAQIIIILPYGTPEP
jgi:PAS domain S-box-containing protein